MPRFPSVVSSPAPAERHRSAVGPHPGRARRPLLGGVVLTWVGVCGGAVGCDPGVGTETKSTTGTVGGGSGDDGRAATDQPIELVADAPAFYAESGDVPVSGRITDGKIGEITVLTIDGKDAVLGASRTFSGTVSLPGDVPWRVVDLHVEDDEGRTGTIQVQVARATTAPATDPSVLTLAGPDALDALSLHVSTFVRSAALAPPEGTLFERTCDPINEPAAELGFVTEELRLTGTARVVSFAAAVETDDEALHVDLQGTRLGWGAEVVSTLDGVVFTREAELLIDLSRADDLPGSPCDAAWVAVSRAPEPTTWSAEFSWPPSCFDAEDAGAAAALLYPGTVPPELDRASCAWADWLDDALATELTGHTVTAVPTVDRAGLALDHDTTPTTPAPVRTLASTDALASDALVATVAPERVGPALHAAAALDRLELGDATEAGVWVTWSRTAPVEGVTTLAADDAGALGVLPVPVGFRVERDGSACATGHAIPGPTVAGVTDTPTGVALAIAPAAVGADVVDTCDLSDTAWQAILDEVVASAFDGRTATYAPAAGLLRLGTTPVSAAASTGVQATVDVPSP